VILRVPWRVCNFLGIWVTAVSWRGILLHAVVWLVGWLLDVIQYGIRYRHWIRLHICKELETRLRAGRPGFGFRQGGGIYYLRRRVWDGCGVHLSRSSYSSFGAGGVVLAARLRLVPGLGVRGAVPPLPASSWRVV
jgi:hypothetical protein